jgi:hypothetical protein
MATSPRFAAADIAQLAAERLGFEATAIDRERARPEVSRRGPCRFGLVKISKLGEQSTGRRQPPDDAR